MTISNQITTFFHCARCHGEIPRGVAPREWVRLEVGWTEQGLQVWCIRHELNVVHLDFLGQKIAYAGDVPPLPSTAAPVVFEALKALVAAHDEDPPMLTDIEWENARVAIAEAE